MILVEAFRRGNLDNKAREDIIRVMDMWVTLHNKWVAALVADELELWRTEATKIRLSKTTAQYHEARSATVPIGDEEDEDDVVALLVVILAEVVSEAILELNDIW
ncbi:hypothetical protein G4B88_001315 [Cannabis sativa]|uniref:Uncharacterized protein n=1 Tax=Cannabis sativa TaxID=3483 RepID=A0A7J6I2A7_CANSA|nr:hypothetical protein G4B88_001315 [Cannabis sativa]